MSDMSLYAGIHPSKLSVEDLEFIQSEAQRLRITKMSVLNMIIKSFRVQQVAVKHTGGMVCYKCGHIVVFNIIGQCKDCQVKNPRTTGYLKFTNPNQTEAV